jgi:hypothetical protein
VSITTAPRISASPATISITRLSKYN